MRVTSKGVLITLVLAVAVGSCSQQVARNRSAEEAKTPHDEASAQLAQGRALLAGRQYDKAMDEFVAAAAYTEATSEAVAGAVEAMDGKVNGDRLRERLDAAVALQKRLPTTADRTPLAAKVQEYLLSAVLQQTKQADALLNDRTKFIWNMRDNGEGDVRSATAGGRILTEAEVAEAQTHMKELGVPYVFADLYIHHERLAAAMDRLAEDDEKYLRQEEVSDGALDAMAESCAQLADSLWPVQRRLDKMAPGWRQG